MTELLIHPNDIPLYPEQVVAVDDPSDPYSTRRYYTRLLNDIVECHRRSDGGWEYEVHILFAKEASPARLKRHVGRAHYRRNVIPAAKQDIQRMHRRLHELGGL